ncbi:MAG: cytochrome C oxidase subunit IV family protein [Bacteroidia bacterium]|jgi:cytochrome c oxidase subunit IV|nr:cytochrome C oxidase subunit IV family protein [Bacteroidia bacterium]
MSAHTADQIVHHDAPSDMKAKIWRTFWILLVLTLVDIAFYFIFPPSTYRNWLFIVLGIVKAYFIVSIFMHMKFEKKFLAWMIVLPMSFVVYLITLMIIEGGYTDDSRNKNDGNTPAKKTEQHDNHSGH